MGAVIIIQNSDGTFSARNHKKDQYIDVLGSFLCDFVDTREKINWVFEQNRWFSTIAHFDDLDQQKTPSNPFSVKTEALMWPKDFRIDPEMIMIAGGENDPYGVLNNVSWSDIVRFAGTSYLYAFLNDTWSIAISVDDIHEKTIFWGVDDYLKSLEVMENIADAPEDILKNIKRPPRTPRVKTVKDIENIFHSWATMDKKFERAARKELNEYGVYPNMVVFDRSLQRYKEINKSKKDLTKKLSSLLDTKPLKKKTKL